MPVHSGGRGILNGGRAGGGGIDGDNGGCRKGCGGGAGRGDDRGDIHRTEDFRGGREGGRDNILEEKY